MGGGSADAAAILRHATALAPIADELVTAVAAGLGADVPGQLRPGISLGTGAGERLTAVPAPAPHAVLVLPAGLRALHRRGLPRGRPARARPRSVAELRAAERALTAGEGDDWLGVNDLQAAALSLAPDIARGA